MDGVRNVVRTVARDGGESVKVGMDKSSNALISEDLTTLLGHAPVDWSAEALTHNVHNAATGGIWRVRFGTASVVLKVLSPGDRAASEEWSPSQVPSHWNYWEHEALAYEYSLALAYSPAGISGPRLLALNRRPDGDAVLWMEDASRDGAVPGTHWGLADYRRFARALGLAQGRIAIAGMVPAYPWLTRSFLRDYLLSKRVNRDVLYSNEAWQRPLVRNNFPDGLRRGLVRLHGERQRYFSLMWRLPRTLCHLDVWPNNLFVREDGSFTLVDWSFVGEGALGEDVGNLVPDSIFDLFVPARELPNLDQEVFAGYAGRQAQVLFGAVPHPHEGGRLQAALGRGRVPGPVVGTSISGPCGCCPFSGENPRSASFATDARFHDDRSFTDYSTARLASFEVLPVEEVGSGAR